MRVYVAGPMTGKPFFNKPMFDKATKYLRDEGHEVVNPCELDEELAEERFDDPSGTPRYPLRHYLQRDLPILMECQAIVLLPDWRLSRGAKAEAAVATSLDMRLGVWEDQVGEVHWSEFGVSVL